MAEALKTSNPRRDVVSRDASSYPKLLTASGTSCITNREKSMYNNLQKFTH